VRTPDGFTLLEVLVALAILGLAVVASIQGFAQGLRLLKLSGDHQRAMLLADRAAREVLDPAEGRDDCEAAEGFRCERVTRLLEAPEQAEDGRTPRFHVFEIAVRVSWDEHRQVELTTLRTVPIEPDGSTLTSRVPIAGVPAVPGAGSQPGAGASSTTPTRSTGPGMRSNPTMPFSMPGTGATPSRPFGRP
jgi:prepilin-type N-terminal cleavage/methylation domain-containing protein